MIDVLPRRRRLIAVLSVVALLVSGIGVSLAEPAGAVVTYGGVRLMVTGAVNDGLLANRYPDGGFHPLSTVNRDAMAAFLYRFSGLPDA